MYIKCRGTQNPNAFYRKLAGWILEVENETVNQFGSYKCAERYVLTSAQIVRLREVFGIFKVAHKEYIPATEADIIVIDPDEFIGVDKYNFLVALTNLSRAHGFHLQQNDNLYVRRNDTPQEHGEWILGWDESDNTYKHIKT